MEQEAGCLLRVSNFLTVILSFCLLGMETAQLKRRGCGEWERREGKHELTRRTFSHSYLLLLLNRKGKGGGASLFLPCILESHQ